MVKGSSGKSRTPDGDEFPIRLAAWLAENSELMAGLVRLREMPQSDAAVAAALAIPNLRRVRLSWELWSAMTTGDGGDPEQVLLRAIPFTTLMLGRTAFWGDDGEPVSRYLRVV